MGCSGYFKRGTQCCSIYENFYVPQRARWSTLKDLTLNIGPELTGVLTTANDNDRERVLDKKLSYWAICKMNMLFHDATGVDIKKGDTIRKPKHTNGGVLKTFDVVLANPPFSLKNWGEDEAKVDVSWSFI